MLFVIDELIDISADISVLIDELREGCQQSIDINTTRIQRN